MKKKILMVGMLLMFGAALARPCAFCVVATDAPAEKTSTKNTTK